MISRSELTRIARARLEDAEVLAEAKRYDGSVYLCGYVVEFALKARICRTRNSAFPASRAEFKGLECLKTHDLDDLLILSGVEKKIKADFLAEWSVVARWDPQVRYQPIGAADQKGASSMIVSAKKLLEALT